MKRILAFLAFLLSAQALAVDTPIGCSGANCKIKIETRDGSGNKVIAATFDGNATQTFTTPSTGTVAPSNASTFLHFGSGSATPAPSIQGNSSQTNQYALGIFAYVPDTVGHTQFPIRFFVRPNVTGTTFGTRLGTSGAYEFDAGNATILSGTQAGVWSVGPSGSNNNNLTVNGDATLTRSVGSGVATKLSLINSSTASTLSFTIGSGNTSPTINVSTNDDLVVQTNNVERFRVKGTGEITVLGNASGTAMIVNGGAGSVDEGIKVQRTTGLPNQTGAINVRGGTFRFTSRVDSAFGDFTWDVWDGTATHGVMSVSNNGNRMYGTTTATSDEVLLLARSQAQAANQEFMNFFTGGASLQSPGTNSFQISVNGTNNGLTFVGTSDARLKKDIVALDLKEELAKVIRLRPVTFNWKNGSAGGPGWLAQDFQKVFPEKVRMGDNGYLKMEQGEFSPHIVAAIKALKMENDQLRARLDAAGL